MDRNLTTDCTDYADLDTKKDNTKIKTDVAGEKNSFATEVTESTKVS
jgi:hypothetical protein